MAVITSIKPQKNKKRVSLYLDGEFGFGLDLENFVKLGLKTGMRLKDEEIREIVKKAEFQKVLDKLLKFASLRPRSEKEFNLWLKKHKVHQSLHEDLFNRLKRLELIGDEKFAKWWVEQRLQFKYKSKRELEFELRNKGIAKEIVDQVIGESVNQESQLAMAKKLIEKKYYKWGKLPPFNRKMKMRIFLGCD